MVFLLYVNSSYSEKRQEILKLTAKKMILGLCSIWGKNLGIGPISIKLRWQCFRGNNLRTCSKTKWLIEREGLWLLTKLGFCRIRLRRTGQKAAEVNGHNALRAESQFVFEQVHQQKVSIVGPYANFFLCHKWKRERLGPQRYAWHDTSLSSTGRIYIHIG